MILIITALFAAALYLTIREVQSGYNTLQVTRRVLNSGKIKISVAEELFNVLLKAFSFLNQRLPLETYREKLAKRLKECQSEKEYKPDMFLAYKEIMALTGFVIYAVLFQTADMYTFLVAFGLFFYPDIKIKGNKEKYEKQILKELPFSLDIITVCVEAGLTFDNAIIKYVSKAADSVLRGEFENYLKDVKIGKSRGDALKDMAERVNMQEFSFFMSAIVQSEKLGTSIAGALRLQTKQIRIKRVQRVEKQALQAPVKLMLPLVLFILPVIFIVIFGPVAIRLIKNM